MQSQEELTHLAIKTMVPQRSGWYYLMKMLMIQDPLAMFQFLNSSLKEMAENSGLNPELYDCIMCR